MPLVELLPNRKMVLNLHPGQEKAWDSTARFVCVLGGTQGGKTSWGPHWLRREIQLKGPGDYLVVTPTFPLLSLKALPEFLDVFRRILRLGDYVGSPTRCFTFSTQGELQTFGSKQETPTRVYFGHASDSDSLESATAKAAWLDEAGQKKFRLSSWEAIQRRLSIHQGRALITTTPYDLGWLKQKIYDPWKKGDKTFDVIRFDSTENPAFPQEEFERARKMLPAWKFDLFYRAIFTRPAGMIYDSFDDVKHTHPRFDVPPDWTERYLGLDFGGVNTAGVFYVRDPRPSEKGELYLYQTYKAGSRTAKEHVDAIRRIEPMEFSRVVGGSKSEGQWRAEFGAAGMRVDECPVKEVEVGIDRVYGFHRRDDVIVFADLDAYLDEKMSYSREVDDAGEPTEKIDDQHAYHYLDAERYILSWLHEHEDSGSLPMVLIKRAQ